MSNSRWTNLWKFSLLHCVFNKKILQVHLDVLYSFLCGILEKLFFLLFLKMTELQTKTFLSKIVVSFELPIQYLIFESWRFVKLQTALVNKYLTCRQWKTNDTMYNKLHTSLIFLKIPNWLNVIFRSYFYNNITIFRWKACIIVLFNETFK